MICFPSRRPNAAARASLGAIDQPQSCGPPPVIGISGRDRSSSGAGRQGALRADRDSDPPAARRSDSAKMKLFCRPETITQVEHLGGVGEFIMTAWSDNISYRYQIMFAQKSGCQRCIPLPAEF
jgi:hypothetical protein